MQRHRRARHPILERLEHRCLTASLTASQVRAAYGLDAITFTTRSGATVTGDGRGETIALIEAYHSPHLVSDLHTFDRAFGLPDPALSVVNLAGRTTNAGWALEEALDVEWAHAIAPGARILVIEAPSQARQAFVAAIDRARRAPRVVAVSMSWGFGETRTESSAHFKTPAGHGGVTFVAASGDDGPLSGPEWPAVSPNVLAVGGTTLVLDSAGHYVFETAWNESSGGDSQFFGEPSFQASVQSSGKRRTPDVAFDANPQTGVAVYETAPHSNQGSWQRIGGTSLGTPAWAAIIAIVDQGRALAGNPSLDGATQTLPALYALPSTDFHQIGSPFGGDNRIAAELSVTTGLGSPIGPLLVSDLVASFPRSAAVRA
jgi:subtilase family serine protease